MSRKPTPQQAACIEAAVNPAIRVLKIEACAGAGKTSTLTMMAEALPVPSAYWCFNKSNADEAALKFPKHVKCSTSHSTAFSFFGRDIAHKLKRPMGKYRNVAGTGSEIGRLYKLSPVELNKDTTLSQAYLGLLVRTTVARFEQSADMELSKKHLPRGELKDIELKAGVSMGWLEVRLVDVARQLWADRINPSSVVLATHDTYLKLYQMSKPVLGGIQVLYVDEFQDTTPCVLDIVMNQKCKVIVVGDSRQAIYGWRGATNALKAMDCETRSLTKSFRYGQAVADIATIVLEGAMKIEGFEKITSLASFDCVDTSKPYTRLFRTNAALLTAAVLEIQAGTEISIEIDVKDFVKLLQSAVALRENNMKEVKHDKLLPFKNWTAMVEESKFDPELSRIVKVINSGDAYSWIEVLQNHRNSAEAHVTFTTAHKSKGREFAQVIIEGDFKSAYNEDGEFVGLSEEEQNLLYVACTRAIERLQYNQTVAEYIQQWNEVVNDEETEEAYTQLVSEGIKALERDMYEAMAA